jgi:hypothetical protein
MRNFKDKLAHFMYGRYGIDQLYYALLVVYFVLMFVNSFVNSPIISTLIWIVLIGMIFRTFSRNIYRRSIENQKFMKIWNPLKSKGSLSTRRIKEIKTHRFRNCPNCKKALRLPRKTGKHTVKCPCCHNEFKIRILL